MNLEICCHKYQGLLGVGVDPAGVMTPVDPAGVGVEKKIRGHDPAGAGVKNIFRGHDPAGVDPDPGKTLTMITS